MSIEILSPFSGRPVKIRPQDVSKAVRDEENRLFYVLPRPDGTGYYSAPTKAGGAKDILRYDRYLERMAGAKKVTTEQSKTHIIAARKSHGKKKLIAFLIALIAGAAAAWWLFTQGPLS